MAWKAVYSVRAVDPNDEFACLRAENGLATFLKQLRAMIAKVSPNAEAAHLLTERVLAFVDGDALARTYVKYGTSETLAIAIEAFRLHLASCGADADTWSTCLNRFEGIDEIPLMTVHKSKGLEYDTILFVGLDDKMWWSHSAGNPEGIETFFVALSRAKQCAIFTFCPARGNRTRVADVFQLLTSAGVSELQY